MTEAHASPLTRTLRLGTRASALARWQTEWVRAQLSRRWPALDCQVVPITTAGDRIVDKPLPEIGGKGLFTEELEQALRSGEIDLAVHSLKDLPVEVAPGLALGAIAQREDAHDVLISRDRISFAGLPSAARVGTSSLRRSAQVLAARPDLSLLPLRGNVDTRLRKALNGEYDAIVLAAAGVLRLGLGEHIVEYLDFDLMLPAPGQGALAVQCRAEDDAVLDWLRPLDDPATRAAVTAERAFLDGLGGGCSLPVAAYAAVAPGATRSAAASRSHRDEVTAYAAITPDATLRLMGLVAARDGSRIIRVSGAGAGPLALGAALAQQALAQGAGALLP